MSLRSWCAAFVTLLALRAFGQDDIVPKLREDFVYALPAQVRYAPPPVTTLLRPADEAKLQKAFTEFFTAPTNRQAT